MNAAKAIIILLLTSALITLVGCAQVMEKYEGMSQTGKNTTAAGGGGLAGLGLANMLDLGTTGKVLLTAGGAAAGWFASDAMQNAAEDLTTAFKGTNIKVEALKGDKEKLLVTIPVNFASGSYQIPKAMKANLITISKALNKHGLKAQIVGHTDTSGNPDKNLKLSEQRANAVKGYMETKGGADKKKLSSIGLGSSDLLNEQNGRAAENRRIEFIIVED